MNGKLANIVFFLSLLCLLSCSIREEESDFAKEKVAVSFAAGIRTRVVDTNWESGDIIGVTMLKSGLSEVMAGTFNRQYRASVSGVLSEFLPFTVSETIYYPIENSKVDFLAYYPYSERLKSQVDYQLSIADQNNPDLIDLMIAKTAGVDKDSPNVGLDFRHQLANLIFLVKPGDLGKAEKLSGAELKIKNVPLEASCNLYTGEIDASKPGDVRALMNTHGTEGQAIVFPRKPGNEVWLEILLTDGSIYSAYINAENEWKQGTCYTYTISLRNRPVPVDVSVSITDWVVDNQEGRLE